MAGDLQLWYTPCRGPLRIDRGRLGGILRRFVFIHRTFRLAFRFGDRILLM